MGDNNTAFEGGFFLVGENNFWLGGIHIKDPSTKNNPKPIPAVAPGKVIAYRVSSDFHYDTPLPTKITVSEYNKYKNAELFHEMNLYEEAVIAYREAVYNYRPALFPETGRESWISQQAVGIWFTLAELEALLGMESRAIQTLCMAVASSPGSL